MTPPFLTETAGELHSAPVEDFSLSCGGPFHRLLLHWKITGQRAPPVWRVTVALMLTWLPLLILSAAQDLALGGQVRMPFLYDYAANARCLISLPLLIVAVPVIGQRVRMVMMQFLKSGLVKPAGLGDFEATIGSIAHWRDHWMPEFLLAILACVVSWRIPNQEAFVHISSTWHWLPGSSPAVLSYAGWWFALVSTPVYRFLMLRWLWRFLLWAYFLWRVSRLDLALTPTHPDLAGGLGFVSQVQVGFSIIVLAESTAVAGQLANVIAYEGATIPGLKFVIAGYCVLAVLLQVAPLLLTNFMLREVKRRGLLEYGALASSYTQAFDRKWIRHQSAEDEPLLGSSDLQSLADLGNSFSAIRNMRVTPIDKGTLFGLLVPAVAPMLLVVFIATPAEELIQTVLRLIA